MTVRWHEPAVPDQNHDFHGVTAMAIQKFTRCIAFALSSDKNSRARMKKTKRVFCVMAVSAMLSACGGGGGGGSAASNQAQQQIPKTVLIETYGDSTMVGCTNVPGAPATGGCPANFDIASHREPVTVQYLLQQQFGALVTVQDHAVQGTGLPQLLNGTDGYPTPWTQTMAQSKAQIVIVNDGINDAAIPGITPDQFAANLDQVISIAKANGKTIVLETANPIKVGDIRYPALAGLVAAELQTAKKWDVAMIDQYGYLSSLPDWLSMLSDNVHPTDTGYLTKGQYSAGILAPAVAWIKNH